MIQQTPEAEAFKQGLRTLLERETTSSSITEIQPNANIYITGDRNDMVYFIISGQVKLIMISPEGKECIIAIHSAGDIFGELCLSELKERSETATTMIKTKIKKISGTDFLSLLSNNSLLPGFVRYMAVRISNQQQVITNLVTIDSEQRLGHVLLQLAHTLGKKDPQSILINVKITHNELSTMVGTTRPRISLFMKRFKELGLLIINKEKFIIIKEQKMIEYLASKESEK